MGRRRPGAGPPFALRNLTEWDGAAAEGDVELTADAAGRVLRRGQPVAPGDLAWLLPLAVRAGALAFLVNVAPMVNVAAP